MASPIMSPTTADFGLTQREVEVLEALATGKTAVAAAHDLGISHQTLKNHLTNAYAQMDVRSLVGAYAKLGWLHKDQPSAHLVVTVKATDLPQVVAFLQALSDFGATLGEDDRRRFEALWSEWNVGRG